MDAPLDASGILGKFWHVIRCGRVSGLEVAAFYAPRACMEICRSGPVRLPALGGASSGIMVLPTRSRDRLPLLSLAPSHIRRQPDRWPTRPPSPDPYSPLRCAAAPRLCAPCSWPEPPRPASSACAPAFGEATSLQAHPCVSPIAPRQRPRLLGLALHRHEPAWSDGMLPPRWLPHRPCRSFVASRTA